MAIQKFLDNQIGLPTLWAIIKQLFVSKKDIATKSTAGVVKPDGETITITGEGVISSVSTSTSITLEKIDEICVKPSK